MIKGLITFIIIILIVWLVLGLYLIYGVDSFSDMDKFDVIIKAPKLGWETFWNWIRSV